MGFGEAKLVEMAASASGPQSITLNINGDTSNYNIFNAAGSPASAVAVTVIIATGVTVGGVLGGNAPAMTTGTGWVAGSTILIVLQGTARIYGNGGAGGPAGLNLSVLNGSDGHSGATALDLRWPVSIEIAAAPGALIMGGGGGGGGGGNGLDTEGTCGGGGGGGGEGSPGGSGGHAGFALLYPGANGGDGTISTFGMMGVGGSAPSGRKGGNGGNGGAPGQAGGGGQGATSNETNGLGGNPGSAGYAIVLNGNTLTYVGGTPAAGQIVGTVA